MKKVLGAMLSLILLAGAVAPVAAQTCRSRYGGRTRQSRSYGYDNSRRVYYNQGYRSDRGYRYDQSYRYNQGYRNGSFWDRHRDKLTLAAGTGAGAAIGGIAGGRRGALISALLGAGGSALYTYKLRDRNQRRYYRR